MVKIDAVTSMWAKGYQYLFNRDEVTMGSVLALPDNYGVLLEGKEPGTLLVSNTAVTTTGP